MALNDIRRLLLRALYLAFAAIGVSLALSGYPPPDTGLPVTLAVGSLIAVVGIAGLVFPDKLRSGSPTYD
jgi:heme A synthase